MNIPEGVKLKFNNEHNKTLEEIAGEADTLWNGFKQKKFKTIEECDKYFERMSSEHKDFYSAYPTVLRHMLQEGRYHPDTFRKYLRKIEEHPWMNDKTRMDSYADYYTMLYKKLNPKTYNKTTVQNVWQNYRKQLQSEHDDFMELYKKHTKEVDERDSMLKLQRGAEALMAFDRLAISRGLDQENIDRVKSTYKQGVIGIEQLETINAKMMLVKEKLAEVSTETSTEKKE